MIYKYQKIETFNFTRFLVKIKAKILCWQIFKNLVKLSIFYKLHNDLSKYEKESFNK